MRPSGDGMDQQFVQSVHRQRVSWSDGRHIDQLPIQQLDPIVVSEDPGMARPVIIGDRQPSRGTG